VIPSSVSVLGKSSFSGCQTLESVTFESHSRLERIEESAFRGSGLQSIVIPRDVAFVDGSAFIRVSLDSVSVSGEGSQLVVCDSFLEGCGGSIIYRYLGFSNSVMIPSRIVVLGPSSFSQCEEVEAVEFENGSRLSQIDESAFCLSGLKSIVIPSSVVVLGRYSFFSCKSLEFVTFESGSQLNRIDEWAFPRSRLNSIAIPSSTVVLGNQCFYQCESLVSAIFESDSHLESIGEFAFASSGLRSIVIPSSMVAFDESAFSDCGWLENVTVDGGSPLEVLNEPQA
jgi:hypothetical protein